MFNKRKDPCHTPAKSHDECAVGMHQHKTTTQVTIEFERLPPLHVKQTLANYADAKAALINERELLLTIIAKLQLQVKDIDLVLCAKNDLCK